MAAPVSAINTKAQSIDSIYNSSGDERIKLAIGDKDVSLDVNAAWQGVATHSDGAAFGTNDGVMVLAGLDDNDLSTIRRMLVTTTGQLVTSQSAYVGDLTDRSGTITTGDTSQQLAAANTSRRYLLIQNTDPTEDLWVNFGIAAVKSQPSIMLTPYGSLVLEGTFVSGQSVNVIAATTSHPFTAKEG